jgi:hypothetical protein
MPPEYTFEERIEARRDGETRGRRVNYTLVRAAPASVDDFMKDTRDA